MNRLTRTEDLDRHALVMAIWLSFGFIALALFSYGLGAGGAAFIVLAFASLLAAFVGHIIVNTVYRTTFTSRELVLGLVVYAAGLVGFGIATLLGLEVGQFVAISGGFLAVFAAVLFYMIAHFGLRRVFDAFDVVREFRPQDDPSGPVWREEPR